MSWFKVIQAVEMGHREKFENHIKDKKEYALKFRTLEDAVSSVVKDYCQSLQTVSGLNTFVLDNSSFLEDGENTKAHVAILEPRISRITVRRWRISREDEKPKKDILYTMETLPKLPFEIRVGDSRVCVMTATPCYVILSTLVCLTYEELAKYKFPDGNPCIHIHHIGKGMTNKDF